MWKKNDVLIKMITVPSTITLRKPYLFRPSMIELPLVIKVSHLDLVHTLGRNINNEVDEINLIFISDLDDMTFSQYMNQPKSMLRRRLKKI